MQKTKVVQNHSAEGLKLETVVSESFHGGFIDLMVDNLFKLLIKLYPQDFYRDN